MVSKFRSGEASPRGERGTVLSSVVRRVPEIGQLPPLPPAPVALAPATAPARARRAAGRHRRRRRPVIVTATLAVIATVMPLWLLITWPPARYFAYGAWLMPLLELALLTAGQAWFRWGYREAPPGQFTEMIIQVTTAGREPVRVGEILKEIRDCAPSMEYQVWVVTEPGTPDDYPLADRVLVVPASFTALSRGKARALEYSRQVRHAEGLDRADVKVLFNDDDVTLTQGYIERAFRADYDICEGVVTPRVSYAVRPLSHFVASHADDIRTHACLVYCSVFQGLLGRPLHVHGEGMTVTGSAERRITWDIPLTASEDLAFGQRAAADKELSWGWFREYAEITSPWSLRDFLTQRRRWLWGDLHAIRHRDVMPASAAVAVSLKYVAGLAGLVCSVAGLYLRVTGRVPASAPILSWAKLSVLAWIGVIFACGWIGAGHAREHDSRLLAGIMAVVFMPVSVLVTFAAVVIPFAQGDPRSFQVISKTRAAR